MTESDKPEFHRVGCFEMFTSATPIWAAMFILAPSFRHHSYSLLRFLAAAETGYVAMLLNGGVFHRLWTLYRKKPSTNTNLLSLAYLVSSVAIPGLIVFLNYALLKWGGFWISR